MSTAAAAANNTTTVLVINTVPFVIAVTLIFAAALYTYFYLNAGTTAVVETSSNDDNATSSQQKNKNGGGDDASALLMMRQINSLPPDEKNPQLRCHHEWDIPAALVQQRARCVHGQIVVPQPGQPDIAYNGSLGIMGGACDVAKTLENSRRIAEATTFLYRS